MNITVIDGHGGQLGAQIVKEIKARYPAVLLTAIGTNAVATAAIMSFFILFCFLFAYSSQSCDFAIPQSGATRLIH